MDLYPVKKLLKEEKKKSPQKFQDRNRTKTHISPRGPNYSSAKDEFLKIYYSQEATSKRFDKQFTISWGRKREEKLSELAALSAVRDGKDSRSPTTLHTVASPVHDNEQIGSFTAHYKRESELLGKEPELIQLIPLGKGDETKASDRTTCDSFRKIFAPLRLKNYEVSPKSLKLNFNNSASVAIKTRRAQRSDNMNSLDAQNGMSLILKNDSGVMLNTTGNQNSQRKDGLLGSLEDIYYNDLKEGNELNPLRFVGTVFDKSPYNTKSTNKPNLKKIKSNMSSIARSDKNMLEDQVLMEQFNRPYGYNLPFKKHVNSSFRDQKGFKLHELETKAEILRNIKALNDQFTQELSTSTEQSTRVTVLPSINTDRSHIDKVNLYTTRSQRLKLKKVNK